MKLSPYSITSPAGAADTTINNLTKFRSKLMNDELIQLGKPRFTRRGDAQETDLAGVFNDGVTIEIMFTCLETPVGDGFDDLAALWKKDKTTRTLVFKDADSSPADRLWYVTGRCLGLGKPQGRNVRAFFALKSESLLTVNTETEATWAITALPASQAFTIDIGNDEVYPVYDISPSGLGGSGQRYCRFVTTYNYTRQAAAMYHIDITNGGLDTAALVNFTAISVQTSAAVNAAVTTIPYDTVVGTLPEVPFMLFRGGEQMRVTARTGTTSGNLTVVRGVHGSVATTHADNAVLALSKVAFDGRDFRVFSGSGNGALTQVPYWFGTGANAFNQAATKIWIANSYAARELGTLGAAISAVDTTLTIDDDEGFFDPADGLLLVESEVIAYSNFARATGAATSLTRGTKGTTAAIHAAGVTVRGINDLWLYYGDAAATAPVYADDLKPVFALTSTNNTWTFLNYAYGLANTIAEWKRSASGVSAVVYTADRDYTNIAPVDPVTEIGVAVRNKAAQAMWELTLPFGFTSATATNVDRLDLPASQGYLKASDGTSQVIAATTVALTWQTTASLVLTPAATSYICSLFLRNTKTTNYPRAAAVNIESIAVALSTATTSIFFGRPFVSLGAEQAVEYDLDFVLANNTTSEAITIKRNDVGVGQTLRIDTLNKTITYLKDNSNAYSALQPYPARENWLRMAQGSNTIVCTGNNLNIVVKWQGRSNTFG